ncbi:MAG TPA: condensation domain-containing protein, partial [Thermoanaerobaculia bacterium]
MRRENIQDIYPLSPLQQGLLFHALEAPEAGLYCEQLSCQLAGDLDIAAFSAAWQGVLDRHTVLRTVFVWQGMEQPVQVVCRKLSLPVEREDWRLYPSAERRRRVQDYQEASRSRGFVMSEAPLMRLALFQLADDVWQLVWTFHHILLDGWSLPILLREVFAGYAAACAGSTPQLGAPRPFRDYIQWLLARDLAKAEAFWREDLSGFMLPTDLAADRPGDGSAAADADCAELEIHLPQAATAALYALARRHQLTVNTLVQGAWSLLLSRYSGDGEVVFGAVSSGRPADLAGV